MIPYECHVPIYESWRHLENVKLVPLFWHDPDLEFHPDASRILFIGFLRNNTTLEDIWELCSSFGDVLGVRISIKNKTYKFAFCEYADISSVVSAMRALSGAFYNGRQMQLGFRKPIPSNCAWVDGIEDWVPENCVREAFGWQKCAEVTIDRSRGQALVYFQNFADTADAIKRLRGTVLRGRRLQVAYSSDLLKLAFYDEMNKQLIPPIDRPCCSSS